MNSPKTKPIFLLFAFCFLLFSANVIAISPTPSLEPETDKIQGIRDAVKEEVRKNLEEAKLGQKKAYVGEIGEITDTALGLDTRIGKKQVQVATETIIIGENKGKIEFEELEIGAFVIAMGYFDENEILQAKRLVIINKPKPRVRQVAFGQVTDISETKVVTVENEKKEIIYSIQVAGTTKITKKKEGKIQQVEFDEIAEGDRVVAIGTPEENEEKIITAKIIHIIPTSSPTPEE